MCCSIFNGFVDLWGSLMQKKKPIKSVCRAVFLKLCVRSSACMITWPRTMTSWPSRRVRWSMCSTRTTVIGGKESWTGGRVCFPATTSNSRQTQIRVHSVSIPAHTFASFPYAVITSPLRINMYCNTHTVTLTQLIVSLSYTHTPTPEPGVEMLSLSPFLDTAFGPLWKPPSHSTPLGGVCVFVWRVCPWTCVCVCLPSSCMAPLSMTRS